MSWNPPVVQRVLRKSGIAILERVIGLILAAIAVQFMADGQGTRGGDNGYQLWSSHEGRFSAGP